MNLAGARWSKALLVSRWPQFLARSLALAGFVVVILGGLFGSPVGSHNLAIIFVWIAWWTALKLVFIPLGGRSWCSLCPIPMPGEWLQRGLDPDLVSKTGRRGLGLRWPKRLRGSWLQSGGFLLIGLFSAVTLTDPRLTAWVLLGIIVLAAVLSLVFENRAFCSYLCPIGGFSGMYAKTAPVELRVRQAAVCAGHAQKDCYTACPWGLYPLALKDASACGLCMECLRACPLDNIELVTRPFGSDLAPGLAQTGKTPTSQAPLHRAPETRTPETRAPETRTPAPRLDEAFLGLTMLGTALAFTAVFTGPWGALKTAAYQIGSPAWLLYALGLLALNLLLLPGLFGLAVWSGERWAGRAGGLLHEAHRVGKQALLRKLASRAQVLIPLGLFAWIAFTVSFAFPKLDYVVRVLSDPFGWGWDLFGTANLAWSPDPAGFSLILQAGLLVVGLLWSVSVMRSLVAPGAGSLTVREGAAALRKALPLLVFCLLFTFAMLWLLVG